MTVAELIRGYLQVLVWPLVATVVVLRYGRDLIRAFETRGVKISVLGVSLEVAEVERRLIAANGASLTDTQWALLEEIADKGAVPREDYEKRALDNKWIRTPRNAGVIKTVPDGATIGSAKELVLTPLGRLLMDARRVNR